MKRFYPWGLAEEAVFGSAGSILGDTIYFYGGATNGDFSPSVKLRKGAIHPNDPTQIEWSAEIPDFGLTAYRPASTTTGNKVYFLGGADETYNYNGIAYDNGQGVQPNNRSLVYDPANGTHESDQSNSLPMDLRGIASISDTVKYLAGGMLNDQLVSNKMWRLEWIDFSTSTADKWQQTDFNIQLFPNPVLEQLNINMPNRLQNEESVLEVFNVLGRKVMEEKFQGNTKTLATDGLIEGFYILKITQGKFYSSAIFEKM